MLFPPGPESPNGNGHLPIPSKEPTESAPDWQVGHVLTVPNWSFGRSNILLRQVQDLLSESEVTVHFCASDVDHNRTVTAFSGPWELVRTTLLKAAELILPAIDLNRHVGCHPRIGALDVCPFIPLWPWKQLKEDREDMEAKVQAFCCELAETHDLPVFLYEDSARSGSPSLVSLRKGGFGGLLDKDLDSDFGPRQAHKFLGASVVGLRQFLLAVNLNFSEPDTRVATTLSDRIWVRRKDDPEFAGIRSLPFRLNSQGMSQLSMNFTKPDLTHVDPVIRWASEAADRAGVKAVSTELIGVIRPQDLPGATTLEPRPEQIVAAP